MPASRLGARLVARGATGGLMILAAVALVVVLLVGWVQGFFGSLESGIGNLQAGEEPPGVEVDPESVEWLDGSPGHRPDGLDVDELRRRGEQLRDDLASALPVTGFSPQFADTTAEPYDCGWSRTCLRDLLVGVRQAVEIESSAERVTARQIRAALDDAGWRAVVGTNALGVATVYAEQGRARLIVTAIDPPGRFTGELRWTWV